MSDKPVQKLLPFDSPPEPPESCAARYEPSDEALEAFERLEGWLLDARGRPQTELAEQAIRFLARALLEGRRGYHHAAETALETLQLRNGRAEGDDIPNGNVPASDNFQQDVEELLDHLHEAVFKGRGMGR